MAVASVTFGKFLKIYLALFGNVRLRSVTFKAMKIKTSLSLSKQTLRKVKREAKRQRRSVSQLVEIWIESAPALNGDKSEAGQPETVTV